MIKTKLMKVLFISACMLAFPSSAALAAEAEGQTTAAYAGTQEVDSKLYDKQVEIDEFLFGEGAKKIDSMGFQVTSTCVIDNYIQIGITPYSDANADYLYDTFGKDLIKVVEEEQATLYSPEIAYTQAPVVSIADTADAAETDSSKAADSGVAVDASATTDNSVINDSKAEMEITSAEAANQSVTDPEAIMYATGTAATEEKSDAWLPVVLACIAGVAVIVGGTAIWIKKRKNFSR